jgi:polyisoprenoid-binding protein YceI
MKKMNPAYLFAIAFLLFTACTSAPESDKAATTEAKEVAATASGDALKVDNAASKIEWVATKVSTYHTGTINIKSGELNMKDSAITGGSFILDMSSIVVSGPEGSDPKKNEKLLEHLKSPDFFNVNANPEATFAITTVTPFTGTTGDSADPRQASISKYKVADPTHNISGNLTIKGISRNITFPAKITIANNTVDAIAKFNINRKDWDIVYPGKPDDLIRDEIHLGIALKAAK